MKNIRDIWPDPSLKPPVKGVKMIAMSMDHLDKIVRIENESFPTPWTRDAFEYDLTSNHFAYYWELVKADEILGYSGIWLMGTIAHLTTICIVKEYCGMGLGEWLLLKTMKFGEELGALRFTLEVRETNDPAIFLYKKNGYRIVGRRENYYQEIGEDALVMWTGKPPYEG
ncbi:MAG: ribosomal protein S18-alanine N-acetyltransferase [bacterium]|nr:ribosomal protein S18-alanine N-acetyltransferase [bacterium]